MAKPPPDIPEGREGERVILRASTARKGTITSFNAEMEWCAVTWDDGKPAPKMCHQYELKQLPVDGAEKTCV